MRRSAALLALGFVLIGPPAWAEPAPSLRQLLAATAGAPKLMEATAEVDAAKGREQQAQAWRNPELSLQTENFQGEGPLSAFNGAETTLSVAQTFELGGKRQARDVVGSRPAIGGFGHRDRRPRRGGHLCRGRGECASC
jgi:cobalt-zinc-cadmium efflux system outer membrane protein